MLLTEYDEAETMEKLRAAIERRSMEKGIAKDKKAPRSPCCKNLMSSMGLTLDQAMNALMIPENERSELAGEIRSERHCARNLI